MKYRLRKRNYHAKSLLIEELRLSVMYRQQSDEYLMFEERAYRERIVNAADKMLAFYDKEPEKREFAEAVMLHGNADMVAMCQRFNISQATYYNWRDKIVHVFGIFAGVPAGPATH